MQSQIDIMQSSNEIAYDLQEGECSVRSTLCSHHTRSRTGCRRGGKEQSQIDIIQISKEITYFLRERGEYNGVRSTFCSYQTRLRTICRREENAAESDRHYAVIKRDYVRSAGGRRMQRQIDIMQSSNEITYALQEGGECSVRSTFWSHQKRSRTSCRRGENAAVRSTFCSHQMW